MTKNEALKLALVIDEFDGNDESLPLQLLKPIAETLRALAQPDHIVDANKMAQPAQEPVMYIGKSELSVFLTVPAKAMVEVWKRRVVNSDVALYTTPQQQEPRNFCPRCGKRTADLTVIHTCTPPEGGHQ